MRWVQIASCALVVLLTVALRTLAPTLSVFSYRIARNAFLPGTPEPIPPKYRDLSDDELVEKLTVVVGAKDFISQSAEQLEYFGTLNWPANIRIIFSYSSTYGWEAVQPDVDRVVASSPFTNLTLIDAGKFANPFTAWREAAELAETPYVLLMHSDMYPLEGRQFLTEMVGAADAHPEYGVIAPELYEAETPGYLCHHTTQTNLHMKRKDDGSLLLALDGDIIAGSNRHGSDFQEEPQPDFLEDHAFIIKKDILNAVVDPGAAYTMEYLDMALMLKALNTSIWYVPSARTEYRVWSSKLHWQDATFFAHRRSERLAKLTKDYLSLKWGVEFPNTGFSNFVKFSVVRNAFWTRDTPGQLPDINSWKAQAAMMYAWFEITGFNNFGYDKKFLPEWLEEPDALLANKTTASRMFEAYSPDIWPGIPDSQVVPAPDLLPVREKSDFFEPDLPKSLLSAGVAKFAAPSSCSTSSAMSLLQPFCGLIIEEGAGEDTKCTCWLYIAPYGYDTGVYHGLEAVLRFFNLPERVAVYAALRLEHEDLSQAKTEFLEVLQPHDGEAEFVVCGSGHDQDSCNVSLDGFPQGARLLQWSFRLNSWSTMRKGFFPASYGNTSLIGLMVLAIVTLLLRNSGEKTLPPLTRGAIPGASTRS